MSARNRRPNKKIRALERALRKGRTPTKINLIDWLKDRRYAQTTGEAMRIIRAKRVRSESHAVGVQQVNVQEPGRDEPTMIEVFTPCVSSSLRDTLYVAEANDG